MATGLIGLGSPLNTRNKQQQTPLMVAARSGHVAALRQLLIAGADPLLRDQNGQTAKQLAQASRLPQAETMVGLLEGRLPLAAPQEDSCVLQ